MEREPIVINQVSQESLIAAHSVLRNTYLLLSLTLLFSAVTAGFAVMTNAAPMNIFLMLVVIIGFPFLLNATRNSIWGLVFTFAYTGCIGWMLGPVLNFYIKTFTNGPQLIMMAAGSTGLIFLGLSALALNPNRNFSTWGRFLSIGIIVAFVASLVNVFFIKMPALQMALSLVFAFISGGLILFQTNAIIQGGERNYLTATVVLYVSIINIFMTILQLLGMFSGNRN